MRNLQLVESMLVIPEQSIANSQIMLGIKPIVSAVAVAMLSMGAAQAQASPYPICGSVSDSQTTTHQVTSSCTVTSGGAIDVIGDNAVLVYSGNENSTSITNSGQITGTTGIYVEDTSPGYSTTVYNTGTIAGTSYAVNRAVGESAQDISIYNSEGGQIIGNIVATDIVNYDSGTVTLKSNVDLNDIRNSGGSASARLSRDFYGESGSTLRIAIVSTSGEMDYSYLQAANASLDGNTTLDVDVKSSSGLSLGQEFYVIRAPGMTDLFDQVTDNSAMFNFEQRLNTSTGLDGGIYIDSVRALSAFQASGKNAGSALDSGAPGLAGVVTALGQLSTTQQVSDGVSQTEPLSGVSQATGNALQGSNRVIQARQEGQNGRSSGDDLMTDKHAWVKPFGSWTNQDDHKGVSGYEASSYGIVVGADAEVSDASRFGIAFAYANSNVDSNSSVAPQSADVNSYQLVAYGSHSLNESTDINFQADIGRHDNEGLRQIALMNTTAKSDYTSWSAHVGAGLSRTYTLTEQTTLTPAVRADYTRIRAQSYTETGAGALNLAVNSNDSEELILGLNGKLVHAFSDQSSFTAKLGVGYDVMDQDTSITSAFAGAPSASFVTAGLESSPWLVRGGVGFVNKVSDSVELSANYDVEVRQNFDNQTASVNLRWLF
ncbi:autotransporter outer membrane beta-barrel domain-containing protein [Neptunomonas antarctica]|uniref:Outer membrane autotransporter barrel domain-containing protein n=1 Tax=Neptunomonas antarctica TaxID=619304 RepID=A0A1N7P2Z8_9GAMM|nr:autotransporter outer membrane beta-barrel domain-containing protein [Neptunomonas antarctica]SIT04917.1 outer membrane autotransporter barrel domain-containing protein [Neptunomonas antarctica]